MATTYRGLTIRIGGDTTSLHKSLKSVNRSITSTSGEIRKLGTALKLDPSNVKAFTMQLGHMANQTVNVAQKLSELRDAADQIGKRNFTDALGNVKSVEELASQAGAFGDNIANAASNLSAAQTRADSLVEKITGMHREATALNKEAQKIAKLQVQSAFSLAFGTKSNKQVENQVGNLVAKLGLSSERTRQLVDDIRSLETAITDSFGKGENAADALAQSIMKTIPAGVSVAEESIVNLSRQAAVMGGQLQDARKRLYEFKSGRDSKTTQLKSELASAQSELDTYKAESAQRIAALEAELATLDKEAASIEADRESHRLGVLEQESEEIREIQTQRQRADEQHIQKLDELNAKRRESITIEQRATELEELAYSKVYMNAKQEYEEKDRLQKEETARLREEVTRRKKILDDLRKNAGDIEAKIKIETDDTAKQQLEQQLAELKNRINQTQAEISVANKAWIHSKNKSSANTRAYDVAMREQILNENKALVNDIGEQYDDLVARIADDVSGNIKRPFDGSKDSVNRLNKYIAKLGGEIDETRNKADALRESLKGKGYTDSQIESPELIESKEDRREAASYVATVKNLNDQLTRRARLQSSLVELSELEAQLASEAANKRMQAATDAAIAEREGFEQGEDAMHRMFDAIRQETSKPIDVIIATNAEDIENETRSVEELQAAKDSLIASYAKENKLLDGNRAKAYAAYKAQEEYTKQLKESLDADVEAAKESGNVIPISRFDEVEAAKAETERLRIVWKDRRAEQSAVLGERAEQELLYDAKIARAKERAEQERTEAEKTAAEERKRIAKEEAESKIGSIMAQLREYKEADGVIDLSNVIDSDSLHSAIEVAKTRIENSLSEIADLSKKLTDLGVKGFDEEGFDASPLEGEAREAYERLKELSDYVGDANRDINTLNDACVELTEAESKLANATAETVKTTMQQVLDDYHKAADGMVSESENTAGKIAEKFGSVDESVSASLGKVSTAMKDLAESASKNDDVDVMSGIIENAKAGIGELKEAVKGYADVLKEMGVDIADEAFDAEKLEGPAKAIYERYVNIGTAIEGAEGKLGEFSSAVEKLGSNEGAVTDRIEKIRGSISELEGTAKEAIDFLKPLNKDVNLDMSGFGVVTDQSLQYANATKEIASLKDELVELTGILGNETAEAESRQDSLNDAVESEVGLRKSAAKQIDEATRATLSLAEAEDKVDDALDEQTRIMQRIAGLKEKQKSGSEQHDLTSAGVDEYLDSYYRTISSRIFTTDNSHDLVMSAKDFFTKLAKELEGIDLDEIFGDLFGKSIADIIGESVFDQDDLDRITRAVPDVIKSIDDIGDAVLELFYHAGEIGVGDRRGNAGKLLLDVMFESLQKNAPKLTDTVTRLSADSANAVDDSARRIVESYADIASAAENALSIIGDVSSSGHKKLVGEPLETYIGDFKSDWVKACSDIESMLSSMNVDDALRAPLESALTRIRGALDELAKAEANGTLSELGKPIAESMEQAVDETLSAEEAQKKLNAALEREQELTLRAIGLRKKLEEISSNIHGTSDIEPANLSELRDAIGEAKQVASELSEAMTETNLAMVRAHDAGGEAAVTIDTLRERMAGLSSQLGAKSFEELDEVIERINNGSAETLTERSYAAQSAIGNLYHEVSVLKTTFDACITRLERFGDTAEEISKAKGESRSIKQLSDDIAELYRTLERMDEDAFDFGKGALSITLERKNASSSHELSETIWNNWEQMADKIDEFKQRVRNEIGDIINEFFPDDATVQNKVGSIARGMFSVETSSEKANKRLKVLVETYRRLDALSERGAGSLGTMLVRHADSLEELTKRWETAREAREKYEEYYLRSQDVEIDVPEKFKNEHGDFGIVDAISKEITEAEHLLKGYREYYKKTKSEISKTMTSVKNGKGEFNDDYRALGEILTRLREEKKEVEARFTEIISDLKKERRTFSRKVFEQFGDIEFFDYNADTVSGGIIDKVRALTTTITALRGSLEVEDPSSFFYPRYKDDLKQAREILGFITDVLDNGSESAKTFGENFVNAFRRAIASDDALRSSIVNMRAQLGEALEDLNDTMGGTVRLNFGSMVEARVHIAESREETEAIISSAREAGESIASMADETRGAGEAFEQLAESSTDIKDALNEQAEQERAAAEEAARAAQEAQEAQEAQRQATEETTEAIRQQGLTAEQQAKVSEVKGGMVSESDIADENARHEQEMANIAEREQAIASAANTEETLDRRATENAEKRAETAQKITDETVEATRRTAELEAAAKAAEDALAANASNVASGMEGAKARIKEIQDILKDSIKKVGTKFSFEIFKDKNNNTDPDHILEVIDQVIEYLGKGGTAAGVFRDKLAEMVDEYNMSTDEIEKWTIVEEFLDLTAEIEKTDASVANLSEAISDMHAPDELMRGMVALDAEIKELQSAFSSITGIQGSMTKAMMADPTSVAAMSLAMRALSEEERLVKEQLDAVGEKISRFDSEKIDQFTDSTKSARKQLYDAAQEAAKAQKAYASAQGESNNLQDKKNKLIDQERVLTAEVERLGANKKMSEEEKEIYEGRKAELDKIKEDLAYVNGRLESVGKNLSELKRKAEEAHSVEDMAKEREALEELKAQLITLSAQYDELTQKSRAFAQSLAESTGDVFSANIFGESDMTTAKMESSFDALVKRAETFSSAFERLPESMGLAEKSMRSIDEAIQAGNNLVSEIENRMASVIPDEGMMNAEQIRGRFGSIGEAARIAAVEIEQYAFKVEQTEEKLRTEKKGTERYKTLTADLEKYTSRLEMAQSLARNVALFEHLEDDETRLIAINEQLRKLVEMRGKVEFQPMELNDDIYRSVDEYAKTIRETFGNNLLAGFKRTFNELTSQIEAAKARVKEIDEKIANGDKSDSLTAERAKTIATMMGLADERAQMFLDTLGQFGSRDDFATIDKRINELNDDLVIVRANIEKTLNELRKLANDNEIDGDFVNHIADMALDTNLSDDDFANMLQSIPEAMRDVIERLRGMSGEQLSISEMLGIAGTIKDLSGLDSKARETGETLSKSLGMKDVKFDDMLKSATSFVDTFKKTAGDMFSKGFGNQFNELTERLDRAKAKVEEIDAEIAAQGSSDELAEKRVQAVADAAGIAAERARLFSEMFESLGGEGALDGLASDVREMSEEFLGVRMQIEQVRRELQKIANAEGFDVSWVDEMMRLGEHDINANVSNEFFETFSKLPEEVQDCIISLQELNAEQADLGEALGPKLFMQALVKMRSAAKESADDIYNKYKKKVKVEVDDSFIKELDEFSKRMKDVGFNNTGIDEMLEDLDALGKQIKSNTDYYDELLKLLKENPGSDFVRNALGEAAPALMQKLQERIEKTKAAIDDLKKNANLDWGAISSGTVDAELEKASVAFDKAEDKVKKLREELKSAKQALEDMPSGADTSEARAEVDRLENEIREAEAAAIQTKERLEQMGNTKTFVKLNFQTVTDSATGESLAKSYKNSWKDIHDEIDKGSNELMQALQNVSQYVERMGDKIVESSSTIDAAYRDMRKTVNGTESQFKSLRNEAIKFSQTHAVSADTILEMEALGGQLGIVAEQLGDFGRIASNLDIATDISANDIALQLGQISNIMSDLDYSNLENFADALVRLGNNAAAQESSIMDIAQRISAVANVTSMTTPQLLGWAAAIAETGQKSESAATALVKTVNNIAQAVAHGGNDLEAFAKVANMTAEEFENTWRNSSSDALKAFVVGLAGLTEESADAIAALESVGIKAVRQETSLLALSQTIDKVDENILMSTDAFNGISDAWGRAGDSANEAEQKSKGFSGTLQIMQNNVSNLAASLGDGLIPFMNVLSGVLSGLTAFFSMLPGPVKSSVTAIGGLLAIMGMIGPEINEIKKGWDDMNSKVEGGLTGINGVVYNTGTAIGGLVDSLKSLLASLKDVGVAFVKNATSGSAANAALSTSVEGVAAAEANATVSGVAMGASVDGVAAAEAGATATTVTLEGALAGLGTAATGVGAALKTLWGVVWPVALVGLVISGIGMIKEQFDEWKERQDLIAASTQSFAYSLNNAKASAEEYAAGLKSISTTAEQVHDELGTFYEQQASFADTINESMGNVGKNSAQIDSYAETIKRLSGNINDNAAELELLQKAVDGYNELAGSSISIIDDTTGAISIQMDALDMLTESYKKNAETQAWMDIYKNAVKEAADATYQLKKADLETEQNRKRMNELLKDGIGWFSKEHEEYQRLSDANREYAKNMDHLREIEAQRKKDVENVEEIIADLDTEQENLTESVEDYSSALSIAGQSVDAFTDLSDEQKQKINEVQAALNDNGDSLTNYGEFSKDQLIELANSWDKSVEHIIAKIHQMQKAEEEANAVKPSDQELEEFKRKNEAIYEQEKRDRDDFYDSEKRLRDLYYEDRKNQLDDEYDIFKAEKDKEYEWEKRLREDAYDDKKAELDAEYEYEKRIRDDAYDDRKAQLDAEYEWEKRLRDDAYDDYKKTLDDAYDEAKQVSDDWLDDYKDSLDAEVDAFEKATDERIKLMEEEYEAKKKLIDEQEEADTSAIDAQIQAIKDQTAAEEKAAKMAERQQKIAEATAKRDKYSQGSKAWEKYNLELENLQTEYANEDEKERREQLIEELEKEKDAVKEGADSRRDILKESLDQEKEAYKTHRDEQKEELKKYNEEQYEEQKRLAEAQLKLIKDENDAALLVKKRANDDELTEIKRRLDQEAEDYKRANDDELTEIKRRLDQETEDYKRSQDAHLELLKYYHDQELLEIKRRHDDELTDIKNHIDDENEAYKNGGQPAVDALNAVGDTAVTTSTKVATAITDASSSLGELGNLSTDAKGKITGALGAIKEGLTSGDPEVVAATQSLVSNMSDELYGIVLAAQQNGIQVPAEISKAIMENANLSKQSLDTLVGTITGSFGPISPAARTEMENAMLAMSTTLTSKTPETVTAANQFVMDNSAALSKLVEAAKGVGIEVPPALANAINSTPEVLTSSMNELANTITSGLGPLSPNAKTKIEEMFAAINSGLTSPDPNRAESMKTLLEDLSEPLGSIVTTAAGYGVNVPPAIVKAMAENVEKEKSKLPPVFKSLFSEIDNKDVWDVIAHNDAVGYINKLIEKFRDNVVPKVAELALNVAKTFAGAHEINSPSRLFGWYAEMDAEGFMRQWEKSTYEMMRMMFGTSDDIANAFDVDYSDTDAVDQMLDQMRENHDRVVEQTKTMMDDMLMTMREREAELRNQAERMARIMEDGFDPTLTAAYEAIDTIDAGKLRRQQAVAAAQSVSNVTNAPVINISIPQVVMHEKADLTAFSEQIARKVRRELAASLG